MMDLITRQITQSVDQRFEQLRRREPYTAYGVVQSVNTVTRKVAVYLSGSPDPSAGFSYPPRMAPAVGELVRVVVDPRGDRYVEESLTSALVRLPDAGDVSLASTDHPFQIGPSGGSNLVMDVNEIMARNNGATASLHLNEAGGDVWVGQSGGANIRAPNGNAIIGGTVDATAGVRPGPGFKTIVTYEITLASGATVFVPDADIPRNGGCIAVSNGNNGMAMFAWYRSGSFNVINGQQIGTASHSWEARTTNFSAGAAGFSYFLENNLAGARLGVKNNAGFATSHRLLIF